MAIKITDKILSISPYISTSWSRIAALHIKGGVLAITLIDGDTVQVPNLDPETIQSIFNHHALYLDKEIPPPQSEKEAAHFKGIMDQGEPSIRFAFGTSMDGLGSMMQHNPNQADAPDIPPDVLQKISAISKILAPSEDQVILPKAEPNCNCFHCQIARAMNANSQKTEGEEVDVHDDELQFQQWTITSIGDKLYSVTNRLDEHEKYSVFLGDPVGCTCGVPGCEHILAVLKS